jgi:hypothetical protein
MSHPWLGVAKAGSFIECLGMSTPLFCKLFIISRASLEHTAAGSLIQAQLPRILLNILIAMSELVGSGRNGYPGLRYILLDEPPVSVRFRVCTHG